MYNRFSRSAAARPSYMASGEQIDPTSYFGRSCSNPEMTHSMANQGLDMEPWDCSQIWEQSQTHTVHSDETLALIATSAQTARLLSNTWIYRSEWWGFCLHWCRYIFFVPFLLERPTWEGPSQSRFTHSLKTSCAAETRKKQSLSGLLFWKYGVCLMLRQDDCRIKEWSAFNEWIANEI